MTDVYIVALRAIHITTAVFWAGGTFLFAWFHETVLDPGDDDRTLRRMADYDGMSTYVGVAGIVAVLTGIVLYWEVSGGLTPEWVGSTYGTTITVGGVVGLAALVVGIVMVGLTNNKAVTLYEEVNGGEGTERSEGMTNEQVEELHTLHGRLRRGERGVATLQVLAVLAMATAQYL